jgi:hypothetical protein
LSHVGYEGVIVVLSGAEGEISSVGVCHSERGFFTGELCERFSSVPSMFGSSEVQVLYTTGWR